MTYCKAHVMSKVTKLSYFRRKKLATKTLLNPSPHRRSGGCFVFAPPSLVRYACLACWLLSAAQPTDQGEERVLVVVVVVGGLFFNCPWTVFWGLCEGKNCVSKVGVKRQKRCLKMGCEKAITSSQNG